MFSYINYVSRDAAIDKTVKGYIFKMWIANLDLFMPLLWRSVCNFIVRQKGP